MSCGILYTIENLLELRCLNGLAFLIRTSETQVMPKRRVGSQTANLTLDHKKSGIDPIYLSAEGVRHTLGKLSMRATTLLQTASRSEVCS
jgi:hypothetical protein